MGRSPCCHKDEVKKGPWSQEEDDRLVHFINTHGHGSWRSVPKLAGLQRCGKSCRLRWKNYLRPDIKRGPFTPDEEEIIINLHQTLGNRWAAIASYLPQRTDNEVKNFWNTHLRKRLHSNPIATTLPARLSPAPSEPSTASSCRSTRHMVQWESARLEAEARLSRGSSVYCSPTKANPYCDIYLRLWHSEVGEAFRKNCRLPKKEKEACESSISHTSLSVKIEPDQWHQEEATISNVHKDTDSLSSKGFSDSSDTQMKLLLNIPDDSLGFFRDQEGNFSDSNFFEYSL